jgi:hypothetical protein
MEFKPELKVGDKIILLYMEGESLPPGLKGKVKEVLIDPLSQKKGSKIYDVVWENGKTVGLIEESDAWTYDNETINEANGIDKWVVNNIDLLKHFNINLIVDFLLKLRDSGVINMFQAAPFLYMGKERIEHEFYYNQPNNVDEFKVMLEHADEVQSELINGTINYMEENKEDLDIDNVNRYIRRFATKLVEFYVQAYS